MRICLSESVAKESEWSKVVVSSRREGDEAKGWLKYKVCSEKKVKHQGKEET